VRPQDTTGPFSVADADGAGLTLPKGTGPALAVLSGGGLDGEIFPLGPGALTIGRASDCEVFLDDVTVSRHHATLTLTDDGALLVDLGSMNGTYINRRRIETEERLEDGDEVQVGKFRLTFVT
jgi:pSer/pThr/pTyr-binding forkhead associated (FHA) protein